jgi:serine/threonine-protein kinase HipA
MHIKNFSLLEQVGSGMTFSPAYDLGNTKLVNPADDEELALNLNGKKKKIKIQVFVAAMKIQNLDENRQFHIFNKMKKAYPEYSVVKFDRNIQAPKRSGKLLAFSH